MDNEIPLPPPPRIRHRPPNKASTTSSKRSNSSLRKTYRLARFDDQSSQPSSDPALFSSDDIPASGVENYHAPVSSGTRKRRYRGTWWGEMVKDTKRKRADFKDKRLVDSGVWMGSDESGAESFLTSEDAASNWGEELLLREAGGSIPLPVSMPSPVVRTGEFPSLDVQGPYEQSGLSGNGNGSLGGPRAGFRKVEESREHQMARAVVNDCLEKGQDSIDLSNGNLRVVPPGLLQPLQHLTKLPSIREPPISEEGYTSLQPFLRLFLAGNSLGSLPGELFELDALRVLSLRNNKFTQIPPAIRTLTLLQELNLSVNRLQYLPWELLWLIKKGDLKHLTVRPNPLLQIEESRIAQWHIATNDGEQPLKACEYSGPAPEEAWAPIHIATGPIRRFNMEGFPIPDGQTTPSTTTTENESRVPSLREASLLAFSKSSFFDQIPDADMADFPSLMLRLLRQARDVRRSGGRSCSVCYRSFVIARTEWIEWWDCSTYENGLKGPRSTGEKLRPLPFRRLGCSWACVPGHHGAGLLSN
ncbi:hypothetical protein P175DRAFT_0451567 [Aspergillus ochraceoroseus IBT 24754]|uniref:Uncharacterized protein n=2 Tax=Aspergillus ochraceoroseus TaxID=138278 RepID=A0A2T5M9E1_9EURO|nr:uncharacterized protein P175DRAFT_0451567 [Aspergillus ochraceoroseus IBT 24754]PTU25150.1 hypothetical protein P175DRAFT_0451567 [Aspergillus ochraceoroseus IBT 24754]